VQDARSAVYVSAVQAEDLLRPQPAAAGDDRDRPIAGIELVCDLDNLLPGLEGKHLPALVPLALRVLISAEASRLACERATAQESACRKARNTSCREPAGSSFAPVLQLDLAQAVRVAIAELGPGLPELRLELPLRRRVDRAAVLLRSTAGRVVATSFCM
jgi:hypothetical protein